MKRIIYLALVLPLLVLATSCATTKDVMPGENGINRVSLKSSDDEAGRELAIREAKEYCSERKQEAVFINDKTEYKGSMDENTKKTIKKASTAAILVGGMANASNWENGGHNDTGNVLMGAGGVGHVMTGDKDYQVEVKFKCQ